MHNSPHVRWPKEVLLEDCPDVGYVGVVIDQVTKVEAVNHSEIDLSVTNVDHLKILWEILAETYRTTHHSAY